MAKLSHDKCMGYFKTVLFVVMLAVLLGVLINQLVFCFIKYIHYPTYTETSVVDQEKTDLPAITFCSLSYPYIDKKLKVNFVQELRNFQDAVGAFHFRYFFVFSATWN